MRIFNQAPLQILECTRPRVAGVSAERLFNSQQLIILGNPV